MQRTCKGGNSWNMEKSQAQGLRIGRQAATQQASVTCSIFTVLPTRRFQLRAFGAFILDSFQPTSLSNSIRGCIELIASENFTSRAVMECLGSALTNKRGA